MSHTEILKKAKVLEPTFGNKSTALFNGESSGILNWNDIAYPHWYETYSELIANYWIASENDLAQDFKEYTNELTDEEREAFNNVMGSLSSLDSSQTRISLLLALYGTDPALQAILAVIAQQEAVHNESYSNVLSTFLSYGDQKKAFDVARVNDILVKRNENIQNCYNDFVENPTKENILKVLVQSTILEGLFFYSGFAFFYNLAREDKMLKTSTVISYINRDELVHGRFISELFRAFLYENPELNNEDTINWIYEVYDEAAEMEVEWSHRVFEGMENIDLEEVEGYVYYRANKMLRLLGLENRYEDHVENPMLWIRAFVDSTDDTKTDYFEQKNRTYTKVTGSNGFDML